MNINNFQNFSNNTAFKGRLTLIGRATPKIKEAFFGNPTLQNLKEGKFDLIGNLRTYVVASKREAYREGRDKGDVLYKFTLTSKESTKNIFKKFLSLFEEKRPSIKAFHVPCSEDSMVSFIKNLNNETAIKQALKI